MESWRRETTGALLCKRSTGDQERLAGGSSWHGKPGGIGFSWRSAPGRRCVRPCGRCLNHGEHSEPAWPVGKEPDPILGRGRPVAGWTPCYDGGGGIGCFGTCGNLQETWGKSRLFPTGLARPARKGGRRPRCSCLEQFGFVVPTMAGWRGRGQESSPCPRGLTGSPAWPNQSRASATPVPWRTPSALVYPLS